MLRIATLLALTAPLGLVACKAPDVSREIQFEIVTLENAHAEQLVDQLWPLLANFDGGVAHLTADGRTNSIVVAASPDYLEKMLALIGELDREVH